MRRRLPVLTVAIALVTLAAGCGSDDGGGGSAQALKPGEPIGMKSLKFHPDRVQVRVGQKIVWHNDESIPHDVKADSGADFASKTFGKGATFEWTPATAGTVKYECTLHPGMDGTIDVVAK
ncbi:MAG TPA: plastocyanin/azurin family copper-binding protein [Baekduia sp.]|uniref:cupredoxin domain-containing protein n=1 Tax=Baekduia sp. TaxID=2600305 RepID=UPI002BAC38EE|nr:plastocyanin/azurin family copper-binding protein [Baekduia sp.]HMJ33232.1 plastocyanin/azurin family copper-binding protein [Baekduia sp.]